MEMTQRTKLLIIFGFIVLSGLMSLAVYGIYRNSNSDAGTQPSNAYIDSSTGETVTDGTDDYTQGAENYGINPATPIMLGFDGLISQGMLFDDLTTFQNGVSNYFISAASKNVYPPASAVSLSKASCAMPADDGSVSCTYNLRVNETTDLTGSLTTHIGGAVDITLKNGATTEFTATMQRTAE